MPTARPPRTRRFLSPALWTGLFALAPLGGCGDDSKTTGTQVQLTPEDRTAIEQMRNAMKDQRAAEKKDASRPRTPPR